MYIKTAYKHIREINIKGDGLVSLQDNVITGIGRKKLGINLN